MHASKEKMTTREIAGCNKSGCLIDIKCNYYRMHQNASDDLSKRMHQNSSEGQDNIE